LSPASLISAAQSEALLREIEQQAEEERRAVLAEGEREGHDAVAQAYASARRRTRETIAELRREGARRLARAKAQAETEARRQAQQNAADAIRRAWPLLVDALAAYWRDPLQRPAWIAAAARQARERIRDEAWTVEHPSDWSADEERQFRTAFGGDAAVTFTADRDMPAGLRIRTTHATLDATIQGLLADGPAVAAQLLAEVVPVDRKDGAGGAAG
jgi:hypothetical protein